VETNCNYSHLTLIAITESTICYFNCNIDRYFRQK